VKTRTSIEERKKTLNWVLDHLPEHMEVNYELRQELKNRVKELEIVLENLG